MGKKELAILVVILIIGGFSRIWKLNTTPPGLYPDEAINGNQALKEPGKLFYAENNGREGLFINLIALSFKVLGASIFSLRLVSAIAGTLTILGLYLLTRELFSFNKEAIALLASFLLAVSFWHINFSRIGFRGILVPLVLVFSFYFLSKGFRQKNLSDFIISGAIFGLGFYTYIAFRFAVLILGAVFASRLLTCQHTVFRRILLKTVSFTLAMVFVASPLGFYFLQNPGHFLGRASGVSIFGTQKPFLTFLKSLGSHLQMFFFKGDFNWRHNLSGTPQVFYPIGILFLTGLFLTIKKVLESFKERNFKLYTSYFILLLWFPVMLLPGILTFEGIPHALRTIGVIPVVYIFAALGGLRIYKFFEKNIKSKKLLLFTTLFFLMALLSFQFNKYFFRWGLNPNTENAFSRDYLRLGKYLNTLSPKVKKYVIVNQSGVLVKGIPMPAQAIIFAENLKLKIPNSTYLLPENVNQIKIEKEGLVVLLKFDSNLIRYLSSKFPESKIRKFNHFWIFKINSKIPPATQASLLALRAGKNQTSK